MPFARLDHAADKRREFAAAWAAYVQTKPWIRPMVFEISVSVDHPAPPAMALAFGDWLAALRGCLDNGLYSWAAAVSDRNPTARCRQAAVSRRRRRNGLPQAGETAEKPPRGGHRQLGTGPALPVAGGTAQQLVVLAARTGPHRPSPQPAHRGRSDRFPPGPSRATERHHRQIR